MPYDSATSYYRATATPYTTHAQLQGATHARVVIIGGGYAGLNTAVGLAERGVRDVVLLERERIGFGASGRNGGFVFAGFSLGEQALLDQQGEARARPCSAYAGAPRTMRSPATWWMKA
jgi:gamma-glutamylputrescine oxidase